MREIMKIFRRLRFMKADWIIAKLIFAFLLCIWPFPPVCSHIVLTYPPARKFALDYLDNVHSPEPCGMPRGLSEPTYLEAGATFNVTWRMAYPHQGGYTIELLDTNYDRILTLVPVLAGREPRALLTFQSNSSLDTVHTVTLPKNVHCDNCTIRLTHQAREWSNYRHDSSSDDDGYLFRSCADVTVMDQVATSYKCSGHGKWTGANCVCDDLFTGDVCQYRENCLTESDCNFRGICGTVGGTSYPKRRCYCSYGWQGVNCSRESDLKNRVLNKAHFTHRNLAAGFDLYWRILKESAEIDFVLQSTSTSWLAVGWRPLSLTPECRQLFPKLPNETYTPHGASLVSDTKLPRSASGIKPRYLEVVSDSDPRFSFVEEDDSSPVRIRPRRDVLALPTNPTAAETGAEKRFRPETASPTDLHAMDCTDIVIGFVQDGLGQVQDSYTRDRSTPQIDSFYGGVDNLIAAIAFQESGLTTMRFRRALAAVEPADHAFINAPMHVIFARGQDQTTGFHHDPASALEAEKIPMSRFYTSNVLQYHGTSSNNRGVVEINFFDANNEEATLQPPCVGEWRTPSNCVGDGCRYVAKWEYLPDSDSIYFRIQSKKTDRWTGIGFSDLADHMPDSDIIIGWMDDDGVVTIGDRYADGYRTPKLDRQQHLQNIAGSLKGAFMTIEFTRPRITNDTDDFQFMDGNCPYFLFPVDGGRFDKLSGVISKHQYIPSVSPKRICVQQCSNSNSANTANMINTSLLLHSAALLSSDLPIPEKFHENPKQNAISATERSGDMTDDPTTTTRGLPSTNTTGQVIMTTTGATVPATTTTVPTTTVTLPATTTTVTTTLTSLETTPKSTITPTTSPDLLTTPPVKISSPITSTTTLPPPTTIPEPIPPSPTTTTLKSTLPPSAGILTVFSSTISQPVLKTAISPVSPPIEVVKSAVSTASPVIPSLTTLPLPNTVTSAVPSPATIISSLAMTTGQATALATHPSLNTLFPNISSHPAVMTPNSLSSGQATPFPPNATAFNRFRMMPAGMAQLVAGAAQNSNAGSIGVIPTVLTTSSVVRESVTTSAVVAAVSGTPFPVTKGMAVSLTSLPMVTLSGGDLSTAASSTVAEKVIREIVAVSPEMMTVSSLVTVGPVESTTAIPKGGGKWSDCRGEWKFPDNCDLLKDCEYVALWEYAPASDEINFYVRSSHIDRWTGIGFSPNGQMPVSDVVYGFVTPDGNFSIVDASTEGYYPPIRNRDSILRDPFGRVKDGQLEIFFTRPRRPFSVPLKAPFTDRGMDCPFFLFPVSGGQFDSQSSTILKHLQPPLTSRTPICIRACPGEPQVPSTWTMPDRPTTTPTPPPTTIPTTTPTTQPTTLTPVIEGTPCRAIFSYPRDCNITTCIYVAEWDYVPASDEISFIIQSNRLNTWTGIGFSEQGEMPFSDMAIGWVNANGRPTISDRWSTGYSEPQRDFQQDFTHLGGRIRYGTQLIQFTRKRVTDDQRDFQFTDTACPYLIFPVFGGSYDESSDTISQHLDTPVISDQRICIRACRTTPPAGGNSSKFDSKFILGEQISTTPQPGGLMGNESGNASASLTYRRRTPITRIQSTSTRRRTPTWYSVTASPAASPEEMLKLLLLQAGIGNVSIEMPAVGAQLSSISQISAASSTVIPVSTSPSVSPVNVTFPVTSNPNPVLSTISAINGSTENSTTFSQSNVSILPPNSTVIQSFSPPLNSALISALPQWLNQSANSTSISTTNSTSNSTSPDVLDTVRIGALASLVVDGSTTASPDGVSRTPGVVGNGSSSGRVSEQLTGGAGGGMGQNGDLPVKTSKNVVTGFNLGGQGSGEVTLVKGPLVADTGVSGGSKQSAGPSAVSMTPEEMLKQLLKEAGMGAVSIEGVAPGIPDTTVRRSYMTTPRRDTIIPTRTVASTAWRDPARWRPTANSGPSVAFGMSGSAPQPSILAPPTTIPHIRLRVQDRPPSSPDDPSLPPKSDVFIGDASDTVSSLAGPGGSPPASPNAANAANFVDQGTIGDNDGCGGIFRYPSGCVKDTCSYVATWRPGSSIDEIEFTLESNRPDLWLGIGFSGDKFMKGSDVVYGFIQPDGKPRLLEAFAADYRTLMKDFRNEIRVINGVRQDNRTLLHFARKLKTHNPSNVDFTNECPYYKFPVQGGPFYPNTLIIEKHLQTPIVSPQRICLQKCQPGRPKEVTTVSSVQPARNNPMTGQGVVSIENPSSASSDQNSSQPISSSDTPKPGIAVIAAGSASAAAPITDTGILSCTGEFRFPEGCGNETCEYIARWEYLAKSDDIRFNIVTSRSNEWTGIGFNEKPQMPQADIIYGWMSEDTPEPLIVDSSTDGKKPPVRDAMQDAKNQRGERGDKFTSLSFTRKRTTKDNKDYQFTDEKCPYFLFPIRGGDFDPSSMMLQQHKATPHISVQRICIKKSCGAPGSGPGGQAVSPKSATGLSGSTAFSNATGPRPSGPVSDGAMLLPTTTPVATTTDNSGLLACEGSWNYPDNCTYPNCIYMASWNFLDDADAIRFTVKAKAAGWTGIGFNDDVTMANADAIIGWVTTKSTVIVTDRHCDGNRGAPIDDEQSVYDISGRRDDGYQIIEFSRKRDTQDPNGQNYVFGDQKCPFFIFPILGGSYDLYGGIQAHSLKAKPKVSPQRICVRSCNIDVPRRMVVSFRIVDRSYQPELESRQSEPFKKLESELSDNLGKLLSNTPGYRGSRVISFRQGSVIVDMELIIDPTSSQTSVAAGKIIKTILTNQIQQKKQMGAFAIDPASLTISSAEQIMLNTNSASRAETTTIVTNQKAPEQAVRTYAIIGGVCGIIAVLFFLAFGKLWYDRKAILARRQQRTVPEKSPSNGITTVVAPQFPRQQSRTSSVDAIRPDVYGRPKISHPRPITHEIRNVRPESTTTRRSSVNPPPDYYETSETLGNASRKTRRTVVADEHQLQRLSTDESDRTFTTYSSSQSRPDPRLERKQQTLSDSVATYHDWSQVDDTYHRPQDFYFMPSQRRWTQVPQNF